MTPLCELARLHQTDKGGYHYRYGGGDSDTCHSYTVHYHRMFEKLRMEPINLLEIGVNRGCSLKMWAEYFPNAQIVGIDSDAACMVGGQLFLPAMADPRITTVTADQNNAGDLRRALASLPGLGREPHEPGVFDVIIDDGSHERPHQRVSLQTLLPYLKRGGIYVVEDLGHNFKEIELADIAMERGWLHGVIACEGGLGKAAGTEWLFWVECPL